MVRARGSKILTSQPAFSASSERRFVEYNFGPRDSMTNRGLIIRRERPTFLTSLAAEMVFSCSSRDSITQMKEGIERLESSTSPVIMADGESYTFDSLSKMMVFDLREICKKETIPSVSYTHLTLPTILLV